MTKITVYEPVTFLTDVMVSILCFYFVRKTADFQSSETRNWRYFFLFMGISTFFGGTVHGFFPLRDTLPGQLVWGFAHLNASVALFFAQSAVISQYQTRKKLHVAVKLLMYIQILLTFTSIIVIHNFTVMIVSLAIGYLPLLAYYCVRALRGHNSAGWIATGIFLSLSTGFVFLSKFSFCEWFNFNDISHIILMLGFYSVFKGLQPLNDRPASQGI